MIARIFGLVLQAILILMLAWTILTSPASIAGLISSLTHWRSALLVPSTSWTAELHRIPFFSTLSPVAANVLYIALLIAVMAWYYWLMVVAETSRLRVAAASGSLRPIEPLKAASSPGDDAATAAGATAVAGGAVLLTSTPLLLPMAPVLLPILLIGIGIGLISRARGNREREQERQNAHAKAQTEKANKQHQQSIDAHIALFRKQETEKLRFSALVVFAIVAFSFGYPMVINLASTGR